jgi:hypothetical protein
VVQGDFLAWAPVAAGERGPTGEIRPNATCHAQQDSNRRALCGYKRKDLGQVDLGWDDVPVERRCPDCDAIVGSREARATAAMDAQIRARLEIVDGLLRAFGHLPLINDLSQRIQEHELVFEPEQALAGFLGPPLSFTKRQAMHVLALPPERQMPAARRDLEIERAELLADLEVGAARERRPGRIDLAEPILLIVSEDWATGTKWRRDRDTEAMIPVDDEPGADDEGRLRSALGLDSALYNRLRYHQFCVVAPAGHPIRSWTLRFFDTHLPDLVAAGTVFVCDPPYNRAHAEMYGGGSSL